MSRPARSNLLTLTQRLGLDYISVVHIFFLDLLTFTHRLGLDYISIVHIFFLDLSIILGFL